MFKARWAGVVVVTGLFAGCQPEKPASPPAPSQSTGVNYSIEDARAYLKREDPRTEVGRVAEVMPNRNLAAIRDLPLADFAISDTLSIVASRGDLQQVALATVVNKIDSDGIIVVSYSDGTRVPRRGDLAVRMATGPKPLTPRDATGAGGNPLSPAGSSVETPKETPAPPLPPSAQQPAKETPAAPIPPAATEAPKEAPAPPVPPSAPKENPAPPVPPSAPKEAPAPPAAGDAPKETTKDASKAADNNK